MHDVTKALLALLTLAPPSRTLAELVGAAVLPHGDFAYDPTLLNGTNRSTAERVRAASLSAARHVGSLAPEVVVLVTPHGVALDRDFVLYANSAADGYAAIGADLHDPARPGYQVPLHNVNLDATLAVGLASRLRAAGANVSTMLSFGDSEPQPIRWAEVVPLLLLPPSVRESARFIVLSVPTRRYDHVAHMVPELLSLGGALADALADSPKRSLLLISADLAHTHLSSGPYSPAAAPFDAACARWAAAPASRASDLLGVARGLAPKALSCGYPGLVLLHGAISREFRRYRPSLLGVGAPTYYGMMAATF